MRSQGLGFFKGTYGADTTKLKSFTHGKTSQEFNIGKNPL